MLCAYQREIRLVSIALKVFCLTNIDSMLRGKNV